MSDAGGVDKRGPIDAHLDHDPCASPHGKLKQLANRNAGKAN